MHNFKDELPMGLGFSMAMNERAMKNFENLSDEQKQNLIDESRRVQSKKEMERLVNDIAENKGIK